MQWTFGTVLWSSLVFFFWFAVIWMFIAVFADIFRRDMSGWAKAGWIVLIVIVPFLGALIYLIAAPRIAPVADDRPPAGAVAKADQLYDQGRITTDEYEALTSQGPRR